MDGTSSSKHTDERYRRDSAFVLRSNGQLFQDLTKEFVLLMTVFTMSTIVAFVFAYVSRLVMNTYASRVFQRRLILALEVAFIASILFLTLFSFVYVLYPHVLVKLPSAYFFIPTLVLAVMMSYVNYSPIKTYALMIFFAVIHGFMHYYESKERLELNRVLEFNLRMLRNEDLRT